MAKDRLKKVLRIGIILDGKIVQERIFGPGDSVTIGESSKSTFVIPKTSLRQAEFPLFIAHPKGYVLQFNEAMQGKVSTNGAVVPLSRLRADPNVTNKSGLWRITLAEQDRGKLVVDNVTILFQFVPPPPVQAVRSIQSMDFRPLWFDEEDPIFFGFLGLNTVAAMVLVIWVAIAPPVADQSAMEVPDRFVQLLYDAKERDEPELKEEVENPLESIQEKAEPVEKVEDVPVKPEKEPDTKEKKVAEAKRKEDIKKEVAESSILIKMLTTRGEGTGTAENLWSDADAGLGDLDAIAANATGVKLATEANSGLRKGDGLSNSEADIGEVGSAGRGVAAVASGPELQVKANVDMGNADISDVSDGAGVKKVVRAKYGQLKYCYEKSLRSNPQLSGRVEIEFVVGRGGRVTTAGVFANTTGDSPFGECLRGKILRWKFPSTVSGNIRYPFIFTPSS
jgi:outer membrane biosynthesis protein TonB